jgi:hypothetical protein
MGSNDVVRIRVEALSVSITIADGSIAIEQTKTEIPAGTAPKMESPAAANPVQASPASVPTNQPLPNLPKRTQSLPDSQEIPARASPMPVRPSRSVTKRAPPNPKGDSTVQGTSDTGTSVIDELEQTPHGSSPPGSNGPIELPEDGRQAIVEFPSSQTKPLWSDEEVEKLRALYPTHSASAIAKQLGRGFNAVRGKARNLGLRKAAHPTVIVKSGEAKPAPKPRPLSAAVISDPALRTVPNGFSAVSLFDHQSGQCRWIVSDVWPVMYCGAPVMDSSSWCGQHSRRVFNSRPQGLTGIPRAFRLKAWP